MSKGKEEGSISRRGFMSTAIGGAGLVLANEVFSPKVLNAA
jgi:hypothetical protein